MVSVIIGTNRSGSSTRQLAEQIREIYDAMGVSVRMLDLAELPEAIFKPEAYSDKPEAFQPFAQAVLDAEGLVVVTPEYNGSMPGALKYFIDMLKFPESFHEKPVCFVGLSAGLWGGLRPVEHLQQVFGYRNAHIYPDRIFFPRIHDMMDEEGGLRDSKMLERLRTQAGGFIRFIERLNERKIPIH